MQALASQLKPIVDRFPRIAGAYRHLRDSYRIRDIAASTPFGFKFVGNLGMEDGSFEVQETQVAQRLIPEADIVINVGANIGYYACIACNLGKQVVAFEPIPLNVQYLLRNITENGFSDQVEVYPIALSDCSGVLEIYGGGTGASLVKGWADTPAHYKTFVPTATINSVIGERFSGKKCVVIVDIEGVEKRMLDGATKLLEQFPKPVWMVEICIDEHQPAGVSINPNMLDTFEMFWSRGYDVCTATDTPRLVTQEELERIAKTEENTLETHNFLFFEKGIDFQQWGTRDK